MDFRRALAQQAAALFEVEVEFAYGQASVLERGEQCFVKGAAIKKNFE